jgi:dual specificity tyrosine-phosphorylation-regulated kinase 2/3/4
VNPQDHIDYRHEVRSVLGRGAFDQVMKCYDHKTKEYVALTIVINTQQMEVQGQAEMAFLSLLNREDQSGRSHIVRLLDTFIFRSHIFGVLEVLGPNLYDFCRNSGGGSLPGRQVRRAAKQILRALSFTHSRGIVHCDMKPENVLVVAGSRRMDIRVIDYGSACRVGQHHFDYIQSRFYRAPEVILGIAYGPPMDIWSVGCIIAELVCGRPIFPGETEAHQLHLQMEALGIPPQSLLSGARRASIYFTPEGQPREPIARMKTLEAATRIRDDNLLDLLAKCFEWDQNLRITADAALDHPFFTRGHGDEVRRSPSSPASVTSTGRRPAAKDRARPPFRTSVKSRDPSPSWARSAQLSGSPRHPIPSKR